MSGDVFKNYDIFRKDGNKNGGGVFILCDIELNAMTVNECIVGKIECIIYEIVFDCERFFIGCIYRPPYNDIEYMSNIISTIDKL